MASEVSPNHPLSTEGLGKAAGPRYIKKHTFGNRKFAYRPNGTRWVTGCIQLQMQEKTRDNKQSGPGRDNLNFTFPASSKWTSSGPCPNLDSVLSILVFLKTETLRHSSVTHGLFIKTLLQVFPGRD